MSGRYVRMVVDEIYIKPTWEECYAVRKKDPLFSDRTVPPTEAGSEDLTPEKQDPVRSEDDDWWLSPPPSSLELLPPSSAPPPSRVVSLSPRHQAPRTRSVTPTEPRPRRASRPAASYAWRGYNTSRAPFYLGCRHWCCCCCRRRRYRPGRYATREYGPRRYMSQGYMTRSYISRGFRMRPRMTSWVHLPVTIKPTKWYQAVGSRLCSYCKAQGRYQMTSWMCRSCEVPLCLMLYRNCYSKWHGHRC